MVNSEPMYGVPPPEPSEPPPPGRRGLPWERDEPGHSPAGAAATIRAVLIAPGEAFAAMFQTGGFGDPILFVLIFGTLGSFFGLLWQSALRTWLGSMQGADFAAMAFDNTVGIILLILAPLLVLVWAVIMAAIYHVLLLVLGGAPQPYETTFRVVCYASGATYLLVALPLCGGLVGGLWNLVVTIVGLRMAQEVPAGRAIAAVLLPLLAICFCCLVLFVGIFSAVSIPTLVGP